MKPGFFLLLSLILMAVSASAYADSFEPQPHCYQPTQPLWLATVYYKNRYNDDIEKYQHCMKEFIEDQESAVKVHTQAAQKALKSWNDFAQKNNARQQ